MVPKLLSAAPVTAVLRRALRERVQFLTQHYKRSPQLGVILVGDDPASILYTRRKSAAATELGIRHQTIQFPSGIHPRRVYEAIVRWNQDPDMDGILLQRPLPALFREEEVVYWISPEKDVDALHPLNLGRLYLGYSGLQPCTPAGILALLKHYEIPIEGRQACVVGRSAIVGKPTASLLLQENATVTQCHSQTHDLKKWTRQADILVVAIGKSQSIDASYVQPGAVVIDVGIHRLSEGKVVGDILFNDVAPSASAITPVPGGVGPMTISLLLQNTVFAAELRMQEASPKV